MLPPAWPALSLVSCICPAPPEALVSFCAVLRVDLEGVDTVGFGGDEGVLFLLADLPERDRAITDPTQQRVTNRPVYDLECE